MVTQDLVGLDWTMVERLVHPHLTLRRFTPLHRLVLTMMKTMRKATKKVKTMSEAT
jgi:hypothetical protein